MCTPSSGTLFETLVLAQLGLSEADLTDDDAEGDLDTSCDPVFSDSELTDRDALGDPDDGDWDIGMISDSEQLEASPGTIGEMDYGDLTDRDADGETDDGSSDTVWSPRSNSSTPDEQSWATAVDTSPRSEADQWKDEDAEGEPDDGSYEIVKRIGNGIYAFIPSGLQDDLKIQSCTDMSKVPGHLKIAYKHSIVDEAYNFEADAYFGEDEMDTGDNVKSRRHILPY